MLLSHYYPTINPIRLFIIIPVSSHYYLITISRMIVGYYANKC